MGSGEQLSRHEKAWRTVTRQEWDESLLAKVASQEFEGWGVFSGPPDGHERAVKVAIGGDGSRLICEVDLFVGDVRVVIERDGRLEERTFPCGSPNLGCIFAAHILAVQNGSRADREVESRA